MNLRREKPEAVQKVHITSPSAAPLSNLCGGETTSMGNTTAGRMSAYQSKVNERKYCCPYTSVYRNHNELQKCLVCSGGLSNQCHCTCREKATDLRK